MSIYTMAKELRECLVTYFSRLRKLSDKYEDLLGTAERPLGALRNQTEQLRLVSSKEVDNAELCENIEWRERLIFKIFMGIENEMTLLLDVITTFNNSNQDLKNVLIKLENIRSRADLTDPAMKELIKGTPRIPQLHSLLEWAVDGYQYFDETYLRIQECLKQLEYKDEESVEKFCQSFYNNKFKRAKLARILMFTQFLRDQKC